MTMLVMQGAVSLVLLVAALAVVAVQAKPSCAVPCQCASDWEGELRAVGIIYFNGMRVLTQTFNNYVHYDATNNREVQIAGDKKNIFDYAAGVTYTIEGDGSCQTFPMTTTGSTDWQICTKETNTYRLLANIQQHTGEEAGFTTERNRVTFTDDCLPLNMQEYSFNLANFVKWSSVVYAPKAGIADPSVFDPPANCPPPP